MELEPLDDRQTEAMMWVEVDLKGIMRAIPGQVLNARIRGVMDREMVAIKAALESAAPGDSDSHLGMGAVPHPLKTPTGTDASAELATPPRSRSAR
jgi:hypothetical protein